MTRKQGGTLEEGHTAYHRGICEGPINPAAEQEDQSVWFHIESIHHKLSASRNPDRHDRVIMVSGKRAGTEENWVAYLDFNEATQNNPPVIEPDLKPSTYSIRRDSFRWSTRSLARPSRRRSVSSILGLIHSARWRRLAPCRFGDEPERNAAPDALAAPFCRRHAEARALGDDSALKLGDGAEDVEREPPSGHGGVDRLIEHDEGYAGLPAPQPAWSNAARYGRADRGRWLHRLAEEKNLPLGTVACEVVARGSPAGPWGRGEGRRRKPAST